MSVDVFTQQDCTARMSVSGSIYVSRTTLCPLRGELRLLSRGSLMLPRTAAVHCQPPTRQTLCRSLCSRGILSISVFVFSVRCVQGNCSVVCWEHLGHVWTSYPSGLQQRAALLWLWDWPNGGHQHEHAACSLMEHSSVGHL